jgi:ParB-like chromosome segregation protein Spo0J
MSGRARLSGAAQVPLVGREELDDNIATYRLDADGRSVEERVQYVPLDRIRASPFQIRRVFPEPEIEALADSIRDTGLVHPPKGRPHPSEPGLVELMPGELRLRALTRLVERDEAEDILKRDANGGWLAPVVVVTVDDERAESMVFAENEARTDLSPWEWALAWQQRRDRRRERGQPASVRDVAEAHNKPHATVGEYLRVADVISPEVLAAAGVVTASGADHGRMARLPFAALKGIAEMANESFDAVVARLVQELRWAGDNPAREQLQSRKAATSASPARAKQSFQINIRRPLPELRPEQAAHYLGRISGALPVLAQRAAEEIAEAEAQRLAEVLEETARLLRRRA